MYSSIQEPNSKLFQLDLNQQWLLRFRCEYGRVGCDDVDYAPICLLKCLIGVVAYWLILSLSCDVVFMVLKCLLKCLTEPCNCNPHVHGRIAFKLWWVEPPSLFLSSMHNSMYPCLVYT